MFIALFCLYFSIQLFVEKTSILFDFLSNVIAV